MDRGPRRTFRQLEVRRADDVIEISTEWDTMIGKAYVVLLEECLGVVVTVDVDLGKGIEDSGVLAASLDTSFQPG